MARLHGKTAFVAGADPGIGRATAKLLASEGAKVAVVASTSQNVHQIVTEIESAGGMALGVVCDVRDADQVRAAAAHVVETYGGIDVLVNNAFDSPAPLSCVLDLSAEQLRRHFEMGPISYLRTMQACYPYLKESGEGRVINLGSMAGVIGLVGHSPYYMAKEAIRALTRTAALEWAADGILVNNVLPLAQTWNEEVIFPNPASALQRFGWTEEEIAPVVLFLASKDAQLVTGYTFTPDGGAIICHKR